MNDATELTPATPPEPEAFDRGQPYLPRSWHLIQRLMRHVGEPGAAAKGVDRLVRHDYMGSAEFEWGAMPKTWKALRALGVSGTLTLVKHRVELDHGPAKDVWIICSVNAALDYAYTKLKLLAEGDKLYLKEWTNFDAYFRPESIETKRRRDTVAWIVLDDACPFFWSVDHGLAARVFNEVRRDPNAVPVKTSKPSPKGVRAEDLHLFQEVRFDHAGRTHTGQIRGIHDRHAAIMCNDSDLKGRQRINYGEIWKQ